ncbi:MAG: PAS domain S-box protein [Caldisericia bacterium]|nr:PAS domain S-box protein [Caldisericia bacterium]
MDPKIALLLSSDISHWTVQDKTLLQTYIDRILSQQNNLHVQNNVLKKKDDRNKQMILLFETLHSINKLITTIENEKELIQRICDCLITIPHYSYACIILFDEGHITSMGSATTELQFSFFQSVDEKCLPFCVQKALKTENSIVIKNPIASCPSCPLAPFYSHQVGCAYRLEYNHTLYGILHVSAPIYTFEEDSNRFLFETVIKDISHALYQNHKSHSLQQTKQRYKALFEGSRDGFVMVNTNGKITDANNAYCSMLGYTLEELKSLPSFYELTPRSWHQWEREEIWNQRLLKKGESGIYEKQYIHKDGHCFPVQLQAYAVGTIPDHIDYLWATARDITEKKKTEIEIHRNLRRLHTIIDILQYPYKNLQDFLDYALNQSILLTESAIGYIYFYDEQSQEFQLNSWSNEVMKECTVIHPQTTYHLDKTGIWGEVVRQKKPIVVNDFQAPNPLKKGIPKGHVALRRFLTIPILHQGLIKAVVGVANKKEEYDATDTLELTLLMDAVWKTVESIRSEDALRESEANLRSYIENAPYGIFVVNEHGQYVDLNALASQITGYSKKQLLQMSIQDLVDPKDIRSGIQHFQQVVQTGYASGSILYKHQSKGPRWMNITATKLSPNRYLGFMYDVTDHKKNEEYIKLLSKMLDASPASITIHDEEGHFVYANEKTLTLHGYSTKKEFLKINLHQLDVPESEKKLQERFRMIAEHGEAQFEVEHYKKDGSQFPLDILAKRIVWNDQPAVLSIAVDSTKRKQIEEELQRYQVYLEDVVKQRTQELESLNQELESFAYSVAHDLRTPLRGLFGFSQILLEDYQQKLDIQGKEYLLKIQNSTTKMGQLIDDILVLSRASRRELNVERVDLSCIAKRILQGLQESNPSRKTQISIQSSMVAKGDSHLLHIALENMIGNAWKFTERKPITIITFGTIQNEYCPVPSKEYPGNQLVYFIEDNGVGFDIRYVDKLFLPFQRLHSNSDFSGTGIGLATVYRIIQRHHGTIWAHSKLGEGTTLFFTIL